MRRKSGHQFTPSLRFREAPISDVQAWPAAKGPLRERHPARSAHLPRVPIPKFARARGNLAVLALRALGWSLVRGGAAAERPAQFRRHHGTVVRLADLLDAGIKRVTDLRVFEKA